jgi:tetratricopeptide (TPR) repeat protein
VSLPLLLPCFPARAQSRTDSLKRLVQTAANDSLGAAHTILLARAFNGEAQFDSALAYGRLGLQRSEAIKNKYLKASATANLGVTLYYLGDYKGALAQYLSALKLEEELGRKARQATLYNNIGAIYVDQGFFDLAETQYQQGAQIYEELHDTTGMMHAGINLGNFYGVRSQSVKDTLARRSYLVKAIEFNSRAHRYALILADSMHIANSLANLGQNYMYLRDYRQALNKLTLSIALMRRLGRQYDLGISLLQLSDVLSRTRRYTDALQMLEEARKLGERIANPEILKYAYMNLAENYALVGDYEKAFGMHKLFSNLSDSVMNTEATRQMQELQVAFDTEKKEKENALLLEKNSSAAKTIRQQRLTGIAIGLICVLLVAFAVIIFRASRAKQRINLQLERKNTLLEKQKELLEEKQKEILDSIHYARRIQRTLLAPEKYIERNLLRLQNAG